MTIIELLISIITLILRPSQPKTLFGLRVIIALSNSWKESSLCYIDALHWGKYSITSLVTIETFLASAVPTLVKYLSNSFAMLFPFSVLFSFYRFWLRTGFLFLFPCDFFYYLSCSLSIVFVFIKQKYLVVFLWIFWSKVFSDFISIKVLFLFQSTENSRHISG